VYLTPKIFFAKIIKLILWSNLPKNFSIWLNPRISVPLRNRVSNGSRPRMGNLGRVKAVTSNPERIFRLSQSDLLLCPSVEAFLQHKFYRWDSAVDRFLFSQTMSSSSSDSKMSIDSENSEIYYIAEENDRSRLSTS